MAAPRSDLKLLYVIDSLAPGGAEQSLATLAPHYASMGIELEVVPLTERDGLREDIEAAGGRVTRVHALGRRAKLIELSQLVKDRRPTLVHTTLFESDIIGRCAARRSGVPVVSSLVSPMYGREHRHESGVRTSRLLAAQGLDCITARLAIRLHAVSEHVKSTMSHRLRYPARRVDVVNRGRDPAVLGRRTPERRRAARAMLGLADHQVAFLAIARHELQKALDVLVAALADVLMVVPDAHLFIAGKEGSATPVIKSAVEHLGLGTHVTILGQRSDVGDLLSASDVFVLSSLREGLPGAVIEAMALETPIVATCLPQVIEVTSQRGAILVTPSDASALAAGMLECLRDTDHVARRVSCSYVRFIENFTIDRAARGMAEFYERALVTSSASSST